MNEFKPGDVVRLKSGGPWMVVSTVNHHSYVCGSVAFCTWFDSMNNTKNEKFNIAMLEKKVE